VKKSFVSPFITCILILLLFSFNSGCKKEKTTAPVNFTLELSNSNYSALNTPGAFIYYDDVVIIRLSATTFAALSEYCTHDQSAVVYNPSIGFLVCPNCAGRYNTDGSVAFGSPSKALTKYNTSLNGSQLTVSQ
jgi:cytochrome b6-f complex iron-sulfur subunit